MMPDVLFSGREIILKASGFPVHHLQSKVVPFSFPLLFHIISALLYYIFPYFFPTILPPKCPSGFSGLVHPVKNAIMGYRKIYNKGEEFQ